MQLAVATDVPQSPPRIAVVAHLHPSISKGGAEISAYTLYQGLISIGCDAIFIAACPEAMRPKLSRGSPNEYVIFTEGERYEPFYQLGMQSIGAALERILSARQIQLVNFHHFTNLGLGALRRVRRMPNLRIAFTIHEFLAICANHGQMIVPVSQRLCEASSPEACSTCFPNRTRHDFYLRDQLFLETLSACDVLVSPSHFLAERFCEWGLPEQKMFVIENGLANPIAPAAVATAQRRKDWVFGYFGQINPFKGVDVILEAATLLQKERGLNARIRIHGNLIGQSEEFCNQLKSACEGRMVEYSGPYDNRSVSRLMSECDYVLVPSRWWENSPVVIQEAYAAGCPVLCTGIGGMAEKVRPGISGLHFRLGDSVDLARCIVESSSEDAHRRLIKGLPKPFDGAEAARRYLHAFMVPKKKSEPPVQSDEDGVQTISFA
jgi:glycosyltransferase involved in cell wall biosynthesis